ncbi:hypothetical protein LINGRAHAP2_LOCUS20297 [Linum grandiflorum]
MFVKSSTRDHGTSTACYSSYTNSSRESSRIRSPSLVFLFGFKSTNCRLGIFLRMSGGPLGISWDVTWNTTRRMLLHTLMHTCGSGSC